MELVIPWQTRRFVPRRLQEWLVENPHMAYLLPLVGFVALMAPGSLGRWGSWDWAELWHRWHPWIYSLKTGLAAFLLWLFWPLYRPITWRQLPLGLAVGVVGTLLWIALEYGLQELWLKATGTREYPRIFGGRATPLFDPFSVAGQGVFLALRLLGPVLVVPVMEELFFRDFLLRLWLSHARWQRVGIGEVTLPVTLINALAFASGHYQWPSGAAYGLLMVWLVCRTRSLGACIIAHGTTNLLLGLWVIYFHDWQFW